MTESNQFNVIISSSPSLKTVTSPAIAAFNNLSVDIRFQILQFYNETLSFERKINIIIPSIFTVVIVVGLVGNLFVIIVALNRQMRNSTNTLIIGKKNILIIKL